MDDKEIFLRRFEEKLKKRLDDKNLKELSGSFYDDMGSIDYIKFRLESLPKSMNYFERACNFSQKVVNLKADDKTEKRLNELLFAAHVNCTPSGVMSFAMLSSVIVIMFGLGLFILGIRTIGVGIVLIGLATYFIIQGIPALLKKRFRAKANDEVIIAVFYIVAFMRFNSNLELATQFAANYLSGPLSLDFKRILWDLENAKYPNIKVAYDKYLEDWRDENLEFLEAIYLIESSLFESEDFRRISLLDKSLDTILRGSYEKMLHFAQDLRGRVGAFNMIGVVLPILGLIILPLAASFGDPKSTWEFVFLLYDIVIPVAIMYFAFVIIFNRPAGVNSVKMPSKLNLKELTQIPIKISKNKKIYVSPKIPAIVIFLLFFFIGLIPLIIHGVGLDAQVNSFVGSVFGDNNSPFGTFQAYKDINGDYIYGPYGLYPGLLSLFIPLSFAFGIGYYLRGKYRNLIHIRDKTKKLEIEFASATFQLGSRVNEGISAELAFGAVADTMKGTETGAFFSEIDTNIKFNGLSVEQAIFDTQKGAINIYPSELITSSMKIFIKANEKGPQIAAKTLIDLSRYLSEIHMSNERLKDLLAEPIGSMKGQANFLAPLISGVVISIVSLVTMIMGILSDKTSELSASSQSAGEISTFLGESIPTYLFQSVVGLYIVMLIAILVYMVVSLEEGEDVVLVKHSIGDKLIKGMTKYAIIVALGVSLFTLVGSRVLAGL